MRRVGVLMAGVENDPREQKYFGVLRDGLQKLGWTEGRNIRLELCWQAISAERANAFVTELLRLQCDVIVAGTINAFLALRRASSTIPIVFVNFPDPVATGLASSLAKTGGSFTGFTAYEFAIAGKWLEVLKDLAPRVARVALIFGTPSLVGENFYRSLEAKGLSFGVKTSAIRFSNGAALESEIDAFALEPDGGLLMAAEGAAFSNCALIISLAARHRLPAVYPFCFIPTEGGLAFYGIDFCRPVWRCSILCRSHSSRRQSRRAAYTGAD
jgi:putative ABC transport system substrate-binding protein